ncbi:hypothetical protein EDB89DRAFT_699736 [Lactarius sanguifluus]|nr:hypothetical protein EDB89DRAFT_699736 [Lactarius sanguifluus]
MKSDEQVFLIHVRKGTLNISVHNRLPEIWGADANEFNPECFLNIDKYKQFNIGVRVFGNLLTCLVRVDALDGDSQPLRCRPLSSHSSRILKFLSPFKPRRHGSVGLMKPRAGGQRMDGPCGSLWRSETTRHQIVLGMNLCAM